MLTKAAGYLKTLEAQVSELEEKNKKLERHIPAYDCEEDMPHQQRRQRAKVQITKAASDEVVNLTVMVMVECDVVELVLRILECLRWMEQVSVMSVDADTYSPQVLLKAIASIKLRIVVRRRGFHLFLGFSSRTKATSSYWWYVRICRTTTGTRRCSTRP